MDRVSGVESEERVTTIYVVTSGRYDGYKIEGVFLDADKASVFARKLETGEDDSDGFTKDDVYVEAWNGDPGRTVLDEKMEVMPEQGRLRSYWEDK